MTQNGPETTPASPLQTLCCCSRMKARFLSRSRLAPSSASSSVSIPSLPFIFVSRQRCNISKKRTLYSLSAVLNKVLWYHWAEVLTHTHTYTQTGDTLSLSLCLHTSCALPPHILTVTLGPMGSHLHVEQNSLLLFTSQMLRVDMTTLAALITSDWAAAGGSKSYGHRALY